MKVPFVDLAAQYLSIRVEIDSAISQVISETAFIGGTHVRGFEQAFSEAYGVPHVVSCANGTDSLYIIMKQLGIGPGDEVVTVANSWISSSETIGQTGARPVFTDIDPMHYSMDPDGLENAITPKTKAVIAVHLQGQMCEIDRISSICEAHGIHLIEDCAQSHFSAYKGIRAGLQGIAGSFSFYPGKNLGAYGDAGCIITRDSNLADRCRMYANHGALKKHHHQMEGINSRLDGLQAAVLKAKLPHLGDWTAARIRAAALYDDMLADLPQVIRPTVRPESKHSFHLYVVRTPRREELMAFLKSRDVETAIHYPTILPLLPAYTHLGYTEKDFPVAFGYQEQILSLPIFPEITGDQQAYVAQAIRDFFHG